MDIFPTTPLSVGRVSLALPEPHSLASIIRRQPSSTLTTAIYQVSAISVVRRELHLAHGQIGLLVRLLALAWVLVPPTDSSARRSAVWAQTPAELLLSSAISALVEITVLTGAGPSKSIFSPISYLVQRFLFERVVKRADIRWCENSTVFQFE